MRMKHALLTITVALLLLPLSTAIVSGPEPGKGEMAIMSSGSSSASASIGPNGTEWRAEVSMANRSSQVSGDRVTDIEYGQKNHTVEFAGHITAPTPCHTIEHSVEGSVNGYVMDIRTINEQEGACTQVLTEIEYDASFSTDEKFSLEVRHDNQTVETLEHPGIEKEERKGLFSGLFDWFFNLF